MYRQKLTKIIGKLYLINKYLPNYVVTIQGKTKWMNCRLTIKYPDYHFIGPFYGVQAARYLLTQFSLYEIKGA